MKQRRRIYYSAAQRSEIWDRWQAGESMKSIGRRFDRASSSVFSVISPAGGIRPAERRRASTVLSLGEREEISRGLSTQCSLRSIARRLGRSPSTISREVRRNGGPERYRAARSDEAAWDRARPQAVQVGLLSIPGPNSIGQAAAKMVARADCWVAEAHLPEGGAQSGVARDDLPQPVHPGPWGAEEGVAWAS